MCESHIEQYRKRGMHWFPEKASTLQQPLFNLLFTEDYGLCLASILHGIALTIQNGVSYLNSQDQAQRESYSAILVLELWKEGKKRNVRTQVQIIRTKNKQATTKQLHGISTFCSASAYV